MNVVDVPRASVTVMVVCGGGPPPSRISDITGAARNSVVVPRLDGSVTVVTGISVIVGSPGTVIVVTGKKIELMAIVESIDITLVSAVRRCRLIDCVYS